MFDTRFTQAKNLGVTALAKDIRAAVDKAYRCVEAIHFEGAHFRRDIAARALKNV